MFESEHEAHRFLDWYSANYAIQDVERFELYSAELDYQGRGDESPFGDPEIDPSDDLEELTEQSGIDSYSRGGEH